MPPFMRLVAPDSILAEVIAHARADAPIECCGLLAGNISEGVGIVTARFTIRNDQRSATDYLTNARDMLFAFRSMREHKLELLAIYHSHPTSDPVPSDRDIAGNTYGDSVVHLIVGLAREAADVRAWWLGETGYREAVLQMESNGLEPTTELDRGPPANSPKQAEIVE